MSKVEENESVIFNYEIIYEYFNLIPYYYECTILVRITMFYTEILCSFKPNFQIL